MVSGSNDRQHRCQLNESIIKRKKAFHYYVISFKKKISHSFYSQITNKQIMAFVYKYPKILKIEIKKKNEQGKYDNG